jgi:hypothetical protein
VLRVWQGQVARVARGTLLHRNELVASERLLDELWGDEPPPGGLVARIYVVDDLSTVGGGFPASRNCSAASLLRDARLRAGLGETQPVGG